ncbi:hypothetical protein CR513_20094, partial [Mucuna pruriens]
MSKSEIREGKKSWNGLESIPRVNLEANKMYHFFFCKSSRVDQGQQKSLNRDEVVPARLTLSRPSQSRLDSSCLSAHAAQ